MIITYKEILNRIKSPEKYNNLYKDNEGKPLIENYIETNIQSVSYDLTMSEKIWVYDYDNNVLDLSNKKSIESAFKEINIDFEKGYFLKPQEYILIKPKEYINMPDDLAGHIRPRTTFTRIGLIVNSQHINPSYSGVLPIGLTNNTNSIIKLNPGIGFCQIIFEKIDPPIPCDKLYRNKEDSKYDMEKYEEIRHSSINELYTEQEIKRYKELLINDNYGL